MVLIVKISPYGRFSQILPDFPEFQCQRIFSHVKNFGKFFRKLEELFMYFSAMYSFTGIFRSGEAGNHLEKSENVLNLPI